VVASTLVTFNNTLVRGNFLAANGGAPVNGCVDATRHLVYAVSYGVLSQISEATNAVIGGTVVGGDHLGIACDPGRGEVYIPDGQSNSVDVVNETSLTVVTQVGIGTTPQYAAYDAGTGEVYVGGNVPNTVNVISDITHTVVATIPVAAPVSGLAYDSGQHEVFASLSSANAVAVISDVTHTVVATVHVAGNPLGLAYDSVGREVFVANGGSNNVSVISDASNTVVATIGNIPYPTAVAYDGPRGEILVASIIEGGNGSGSIVIISGATHTVLTSVFLEGPPNDIQVDPGTGRAYVDDPWSGNVSVLDIALRTVVATFSLGAYPFAVGCDPGKGEIFVSGGARRALEILSDTSNRVIASLPMGPRPERLAVDPTRGLVFVQVVTQILNGTQGLSTMYVVSDATNAVVATFPLEGINPTSLAVDPDRGLIFVGDGGSPPSTPAYVNVYNETTFAREANLTVGTGPTALAVDAGTGQTFVGSTDAAGNGVVRVLNDATLSVVRTVTVAPGPSSRLTGLAYDPALSEVLVVDNEAGMLYARSALYVLSDVTDTVVAKVTGLLDPGGVAYVGRGLLIVTGNQSDGPWAPGVVILVSDATSLIVGNVSVGGSPMGAVYDAAVDAVYVVNQGQGTLSIGPISRPYGVTFQESGLAAGTPWSVTLGGTTKRSSNASLMFLETNGTYAYTLGTVSGYVATPPSGNALVSGAATVVTVMFSSTAPTPLALFWVSVILVVIAAAAAVAFVLWRRRSRDRPLSPPPTPPGGA
jgi:YVTN family beta-propeller protein